MAQKRAKSDPNGIKKAIFFQKNYKRSPNSRPLSVTRLG